MSAPQLALPRSAVSIAWVMWSLSCSLYVCLVILEVGLWRGTYIIDHTPTWVVLPVAGSCVLNLAVTGWALSIQKEAQR